MKYYESEAFSIGGTPLVRIRRKSRNIFLKLESRNMSGSVKSRLACAMITDAFSEGRLSKKTTIVEATSGNTGIALAQIAKALGFKLIIVMPSSMSYERQKIIKAFGAKLILTDGALGMPASIKKAFDITKGKTDFVTLDQFSNPANIRIHRLTTGPEIWNDLDGQVDAIVAGVGTGGTISGIAEYIKYDKKRSIKVIAVEPSSSPVISQTLNNEKPTPGIHKIQGIGAGFIPASLNLKVVDAAETVTDEEAVWHTRSLARDYGVFSGISGGAAFAAAVKIIETLPKGSNAVAIIPDSGERYLSSDLF